MRRHLSTSVVRAVSMSTLAVGVYGFAASTLVTNAGVVGAIDAFVLRALAFDLVPVWLAFAVLVEPLAHLARARRFAHASMTLLVGGLAGLWLAWATGGTLLGAGEYVLLATVALTVPTAVLWQVAASRVRRG